MTDSDREYLRIPSDATFPTLPVPTDFQEYAFAYYLGAKELWEKTGKDQPNQVPMPDNLVYPILFMIHHFLELELKSGIELTYSIGYRTGEITDEQNWRSHDLNSLLTLMKGNLERLAGILEGSPTESTCRLIEDVNKFGAFGESLRYPLVTVNPKTKRRAMGTEWPKGLIADIAAVIDATDQARKDLGGLISYLMDYEETVIDAKSQHF